MFKRDVYIMLAYTENINDTAAKYGIGQGPSFKNNPNNGVEPQPVPVAPNYDAVFLSAIILAIAVMVAVILVHVLRLSAATNMRSGQSKRKY